MPSRRQSRTTESNDEDAADGLEASLLYRSGFASMDPSSKTKTVRAIIDRKMIHTQRYKKLKTLNWGIGIEHEVYFFHLPYKSDEPIQDIILFNARESSFDLIKKGRLNILERDFIGKIPLEYSGRKCGKTYVVEPLMKGAMPEFISENPMSSLETLGKNTIESYCQQIIAKEADFVRFQSRNPYTLKRIQKYGIIHPYPYGMSSYIKVPKKSSSRVKQVEYKFNDDIGRDYTGSYHITLTLPFDTKNTSDKEFLNTHKNFANQFQWLEPLLLTSFFSADDKSIGNSDEKRIKGSFRVMNVAWGNFAGSDVRKFNTGVGRYTTFEKSWRDGMKFYNSDKLKSCYETKITDEPQSKSLISSNMRTFGSLDPRRPWHRESGLGMRKPNGIEIRIFDHFDSIYLVELSKIIIYLAENSKHYQTKKYVYDDNDWKDTIQNIMLNGWCAQLSLAYIKKLRTHLNLKIKTKSRRAYDIMWAVNLELFEKNKSGDLPWLMLDTEYEIAPLLPQINRKSMELGLTFKFNNEPKYLKKMTLFVHSLPNKKIKVPEFEKLFFKQFIKKKWKNDVENIIHYLQSLRCVKLVITNGHIKSIELIVENISNISKTNKNILRHWMFKNDEMYRIRRDDPITNKDIIIDKLLENDF